MDDVNMTNSKANNGKKGDFIPRFSTMPILDQAQKDKESGVSIPAEEDVIHAKDWVDANEL